VRIRFVFGGFSRFVFGGFGVACAGTSKCGACGDIGVRRVRGHRPPSFNQLFME
jgi:hypothetical protein